MQKLVPVWVLLLLLLLGAVFTVVFAWSAKTGRLGPVGRIASTVASFPDLVQTTIRTIRSDADVNFRVPRTDADLGAFQPLDSAVEAGIDGLLVRADRDALARHGGSRLLIGGFTIDGELTHAAILLSSALEVEKVWQLPEEDIEGEEPKDTPGRFPHGVALLRDGSIIYAFDVGVSLQRIDRCGNRLWAIGGPFGHAVSPSDDQKSVWTLRNDMPGEIVEVAVESGKVLRKFTMEQIIAANEDLDILEIRRKDDNWANGNPKRTTDAWLDDPFHLNDVEPLPVELAAEFVGFEAGDLLLSARSLNLVFVMDPDTMKVKWWQSGGWRRQHDPDWQPGGDISVYDNRMNRDFSRIVRINPVSRETVVTLNGRNQDFYSRIRGKHQVTPNGHLMLSSPQQGRFLELDSQGRPVLEIYNVRPGEGSFNYPLSEMAWFPGGYVDPAEGVECAE